MQLVKQLSQLSWVLFSSKEVMSKTVVKYDWIWSFYGVHTDKDIYSQALVSKKAHKLQ